MGDPAGIGPEIVARALGEAEVRACCNPVVIGDPKILARAVELVGSRLSVVIVPTAAGAGTNPSTLDVVPAGELPAGTLMPGTLDARWGESAAACCRRAVEMAKAGEVSAIVSTPFNKEAFHMAGIMAMDDMIYFQQCFGGPERRVHGRGGGGSLGHDRDVSRTLPSNCGPDYGRSRPREDPRPPSSDASGQGDSAADWRGGAQRPLR